MALQRPVDRIQVERSRIELAPKPVQPFPVLLVPWVAQSLQHPLVPGHATTIFRRAGPRAAKAHRVADAALRGEHLLRHNIVLPVVTEIVPVKKLRPAFRQDLPQLLGPGIPVARPEVQVGFPERQAAEDELVQMVVFPLPFRDFADMNSSRDPVFPARPPAGSCTLPRAVRFAVGPHAPAPLPGAPHPDGA